MCVYYIWLVVLTILKNMKVNGKDYPFSTMENKKCLKPPTSYIYIYSIYKIARPAQTHTGYQAIQDCLS